MFRTPKVGTRVLASVATIATLTGVSLPLMATAASAAVSSVTINTTSSDTQVAADDTITVVADVAGTAFPDSTLIQFAIVSGPDADKAGNGTLVADDDCPITADTATHETATCSFDSNATPGTDTIRVFADTNGNLVLDNGEPSATATVVKYGAPAAVTITPTSDTAAAGTCNTYTVKLSDAGGRTIPGATVNLSTTLTGDTTGRSLTYCVPVPNETTPAAQSVTTINATATGTTPATGEVTTNDDGLAVFGITSDQPGGATVRAFFDADSGNDFDAGEPSATATKTFTSGGAAGNSAQDAVTSLTVSPTSQSAVAGDTNIKYTVTAKNSTGDVTPNVVVSYTITGANPGSGTLSATNNNGQATLTYDTDNAGTDTITFFVNQTTGATAGADANEPKATATTTVAAAPTGYTIDVTCTGTAANVNEEYCVQPLTHKSETFTAFVSKGTDGNGDPIPAAGILVRFSATNDDNPGLTEEVLFSGVTDAAGKVVFLLNDPNAVDGTLEHIVGTIAGQVTPEVGGANFDVAHVEFQAAVPSILTLTPALLTTQTGTSSTFTATVTDQFEVPSVGVNVDFAIAGRNVAVNGPSVLDKVTNASGEASISYTDTGATNNTVGSPDIVTAWADTTENDALDVGEPTDQSQNNFITEPATAGSVDLDVTGACGGTDPANDSTSYAPALLTTTHSICAIVKTAGGAVLAGKNVTFTLSGVGSFVKADGTALTSPQTVSTDSDGFAEILVASTNSGAQNISASIDGKSDSGTVTYTAPAVVDARNIDLKPEAGDLAPGTSKELTALVTDRFGNPVSGVTVNFTETGAGSFSNGTSSASGVTGATGTVTVTITSLAGSTGTESVTATIGSAGTKCGFAAGDPVGTTAGNCSDTEDYTFKSSAAPTITVSPTALNVGQYATVTVHATPGDTVKLFAYSRPITTYGCVRGCTTPVTVPANGVVTFTVGPRTNTRLYAQTQGGNSTSAVISVRPAESLYGTANGKVGSFHGGIVPGHAGVTVRLFTVKNGVRSASPVGTATTDANGKWTYSRTFAATGYVTFISQTLSDLTNLSGQSNRITIRFS